MKLLVSKKEAGSPLYLTLACEELRVFGVFEEVVKIKILYTYPVSRVTYTDKYRACIWMSLGEFRYERYESVYVTLLTV